MMRWVIPMIVEQSRQAAARDLSTQKLEVLRLRYGS
jgi:hypothetical protein